jgi:hypothetical protein
MSDKLADYSFREFAIECCGIKTFLAAGIFLCSLEPAHKLVLADIGPNIRL